MEARSLGDDPVARLLAQYRPPPGAPDELLDREGRVRPVWRRFVEHFGRLDPDDLARRFARGDQYLRDAGVFFRRRPHPARRAASPSRPPRPSTTPACAR